MFVWLFVDWISKALMRICFVERNKTLKVFLSTASSCPLDLYTIFFLLTSGATRGHRPVISHKVAYSRLESPGPSGYPLCKNKFQSPNDLAFAFSSSIIGGTTYIHEQKAQERVSDMACE